MVANSAIKPIETHYKGYRFRSRLEARWAVFFDALGIEWEYEKEGYDLGEYGWYLPDFWLPHVRMWAEVKPQEFDDIALAKCAGLANATRRSVILLEGVPDIKFYQTVAPYVIFEDGEEDDEEGNQYGTLTYTGSGLMYGGEEFISNYHDYYREEKRFYSCPSHDDPREEGIVSDWDLAAVAAARSARFEHGETPSTYQRKGRK